MDDATFSFRGIVDSPVVRVVLLDRMDVLPTARTLGTGLLDISHIKVRCDVH